MAKSYADLMNEISADELYNRLLAHGLFADKLPPILSSVDFYNYCQKNTTSLKDHAKTLSSNEDDFNRNWLFVYEALSQSDLKGEWKPMKKSGVSFVKMPTTKSTT